MSILRGKLYRIMTENVNKQGILKACDKYFEGYTVQEGIGYWQGIQESQLTIEVITDEAVKVEQLARRIKAMNKQDAVLVEELVNTAKLV